MTQDWARKDGRPLVLGHRGARHAAPENTLVAFELAHEEAADGVELDVRLDAEGNVIVLHDRTLERVTDGHDPRDVEQIRSSELSRVDVGPGGRVPELSEVLAWAREREMLVNVELKHDVTRRDRLVAGVVDLVRAQKAPERWLLLSSFHPAIALRLARRLPGVRVAWLVHKGQRFVRHAPGFRLLGATGVNPEHVLVTRRHVERWHRGGARVLTWTVNDPERARELSGLGVDGIISDEPGKILAALR